MKRPFFPPAGVLAGQIPALRFNCEFSCDGVFHILEPMLDVDCYGEFVIPDRCGVVHRVNCG